MNLVKRVKAILERPKEEWVAIDSEVLDVPALWTGYVIPLVLIGSIAQFIGISVLGFGGGIRASILWAISSAIASFVLAMVWVFVLAWVINALAPTFGATQSMPQAIKLSAYSMTATWVGEIFYVIPWLGIFTIIGVIYSLYLIYVGLHILMKPPEDKRMPYTISIIVVWVVVFYIVGKITVGLAYS